MHNVLMMAVRYSLNVKISRIKYVNYKNNSLFTYENTIRYVREVHFDKIRMKTCYIHTNIKLGDRQISCFMSVKVSTLILIVKYHRRVNT